MSVAARSRLSNVELFRISSSIVASTLEVLQAFGRHGLEGLVLWIGMLEDRTASITEAIVPDQEPVRTEEGVGYFVGPEALFDLNVRLSTTGNRLLGQVHSHPGAAYHSSADDAYAIVTTEGGLSLVVPNFGYAAAEPTAWAVYRLGAGRWRAVERPGELILVEADSPRS